MSNMPYCRFQNTLNDLRDCADHMSDNIEDEREFSARRHLITICKEIAADQHDPDDDDRKV